MKKNISRTLLAIVVVILCFTFARVSPFWTETTEEKVSEFSAEDVEVTFLDEDTLQLENLIKDEDLYYCWIVKNYSEGYGLNSGITGQPMKASESVQFSYENLAKMQFQAVMTYDGYTYTSITFGIEEDGSVSVLDDTTALVETSDELTRDISDIVSLAFLGFLIITAIVYYIVPKRIQWVVLLVASLFFYLLSGVEYVMFVVFSSWIAYVVARKMSARRVVAEGQMKEAADSKARKQMKAELQSDNKQLLILALIGTLGVMAVIKYTDFLISNVNGLLHTNIEYLTLVMPLGLSFYTFMIIAYLLDVYRGKYVAEEKFGRFFLFTTFFPHVSQGPLSRYNEVSVQLRTHHTFNYDNFCLGAQRILWGFFVKLVLADRIAVLVNGVYDHYGEQSWLMLLIASLAYSIQIYADFYSSMEIAIGSAQLFGIHLQENFMRPYFSTNMPEFWRRWHITLGTWFKDYVFYPISISKKVMKFTVNVRKKFGPNVARVVAAAPPIMAVWILTGLWHGAMWKFVAWGVFHGMLILLSTAFSQTVQKGVTSLGIQTEAWYYKLIQMMKVFLLCTIGRVFFRAESIGAAFTIFKNIVTLSCTDMLLDFTTIGFEMQDYISWAIALEIFIAVSIVQERKGSVREVISRGNIVARWFIWIFLIFATLLYGVYGPGTSPVFI